jgi:hypothetical protein
MTGDVFSQHRGKFLQLDLTVEDEGVFTTPWAATVTHVPGPEQIPPAYSPPNVGEDDVDLLFAVDPRERERSTLPQMRRNDVGKGSL